MTNMSHQFLYESDGCCSEFRVEHITDAELREDGEEVVLESEEFGATCGFPDRVGPALARMFLFDVCETSLDDIRF